MVTLTVNGKTHEIDVDPATPLLWVLRDHLGFTGTKFGCGIAECGACTVHLDGEARKSCRTQVRFAEGREITTIEGLSENGLTNLQKAWLDHDVVQCGYCQSGHIMRAAALLKETPDPTDEQIDEAMSENICRCGTYNRMRDAIKQAAAEGGVR